MNLAHQDYKKLPAAQIFRHLRITSGMRIRDLAKLLGVSHTLVCHYEQSRQPIPPDRIKQLCKIFNLSDKEFKNIMSTGNVPINFKDECHLLISKMDNEKLKAVYQVLKSMAS